MHFFQGYRAGSQFTTRRTIGTFGSTDRRQKLWSRDAKASTSLISGMVLRRIRDMGQPHVAVRCLDFRPTEKYLRKQMSRRVASSPRRISKKRGDYESRLEQRNPQKSGACS